MHPKNWGSSLTPSNKRNTLIGKNTGVFMNHHEMLLQRQMTTKMPKT